MKNRQITSLTSEEHLHSVLDYIGKGIEEGAKLLIGGKRPPDLKKGYYVEPTIFDHVLPEMVIAREEIFSPVLAVIRAPKEKMVEIANNSRYGLAAGIFTNDLRKAHVVAAQLIAGAVFINEYPVMSAALPFGGHKESGLGVEKGRAGLLEYTKIKTVSTRIKPKTSFQWFS